MLQHEYKLYRCKTKEELDYFKKYYEKYELICTFDDEKRLEECHIFFAVREGAENLDRKSFVQPQRQDEYGTSVISIQFDKEYNDVSIKNRYNHTVENPDCTFSNNLDEIVPGLGDSFAFHYDMGQVVDLEDYCFLKIPGFVKASNGKHYKYFSKCKSIKYIKNKIWENDINY